MTTVTCDNNTDGVRCYDAWNNLVTTFTCAGNSDEDIDIMPTTAALADTVALEVHGRNGTATDWRWYYEGGFCINAEGGTGEDYQFQPFEEVRWIYLTIGEAPADPANGDLYLRADVKRGEWFDGEMQATGYLNRVQNQVWDDWALTTSYVQKTVTVVEEDLSAGDTAARVIRVRGTHADVAYAKDFASATEL